MYEGWDKMDLVRKKGRHEISEDKNIMRYFWIVLALEYEMWMYMTWNLHEVVKEIFQINIYKMYYLKLFIKLKNKDASSVLKLSVNV